MPKFLVFHHYSRKNFLSDYEEFGYGKRRNIEQSNGENASDGWGMKNSRHKFSSEKKEKSKTQMKQGLLNAFIQQAGTYIKPPS
ncbi:hypothetical protein GWJ21_11350 [Bacillus coagulans]|nr:hypothetical protein [Heyndrickxia coagulans]NCG68529.1 hypothetical protein [Heyndrickxia coagulans]